MKSIKLIAMIVFLFLQGCSLEKTSISPTESTALSGTHESGIVISSSNGFFDNYSGYRVVGELINNFEISVSEIKLQISLRDSSDVSLLIDEKGNGVDSLIFSPHFDSLGVGEKSPFSYYFDLSGGLPSSYDITVVSYKPVTITRTDWERENVQIFDNGDGYYLLTGEIVNLSSEWVTIKNLSGGVRDDVGTVLSVEKITTYVSTLAPAGNSTQRDRTPFAVKVPIPLTAVTQWDIWCETGKGSGIVEYALTAEPGKLYFDEYHSLHYVGMISNKSDKILHSPLVVGLFMGDGSVLDVSYYLPISPILPGMSMPYEITNFGSSTWSDDNVGLISNYRSTIDPGKIELRNNIIELSVESEIIDNAGLTWTIRGNFKNTTKFKLTKVTAITGVYSIDENLVATDYGISYPQEGGYIPNASGEYEVMIYLPGDIDTSVLYTKTILLGEFIE